MNHNPLVWVRIEFSLKRVRVVFMHLCVTPKVAAFGLFSPYFWAKLAKFCRKMNLQKIKTMHTCFAILKKTLNRVHKFPIFPYLNP